MISNCRDWRQHMQPSFRGVPFEVEENGIEGGRRGPEHEFAGSDDWYVEDTGMKATKVSVSAYVVGDDADAISDALLDACNEPGPGELVLPDGVWLCTCRSVNRKWKDEQLGRWDFELEFAAEPDQIGGFVAIGLFDRLVATAFALLTGALSAEFAAVTRLSGFSDVVWNNAADRMEAFVASMSLAIEQTVLDPLAKPDLMRQLFDLGSRPVDFYDDPAVLASTIVGVMQAYADAAVDKREALAGLKLIWTTETYVQPAASYYTSRSKLADAANGRVFDLLVRGAAAGLYAVTASGTDWTDRQSALRARADITVLFDIPLQLAEATETVEALVDTRGKGSEAISKAVTDLVPVVTVEADRMMPVVWWAHYLYNDANRAEELVDRNHVPNPSYMPTAFRALAA